MAPRAAIRSLAKLGWTAALVGLAVFVLAASASAKGPPSGKGGPPPWAGGGGSGGGKSNGGGPPAWAGAGKGARKAKGARKKAEKAAKKAAKAREKAAKARENGALNPAMTCFALLGELGEEFYETYGTNPNNANAFGKCVSEHARKQGEDDDEAPEDETEEPAECEEPAEGEEPAEEDPLAALASFDEDTPDENECDPADEGAGDPEDTGDENGDESEAKLTCFLPAEAGRANPFAICVRA